MIGRWTTFFLQSRIAMRMLQLLYRLIYILLMSYFLSYIWQTIIRQPTESCVLSKRIKSVPIDMTISNQLRDILDEEADAVQAASNEEDLLAEEHSKRIQAEADAQSLAAKLAVLQTQFVEYMNAQAADVEAFAKTAQALEQSQQSSDVLNKLKEQLQAAAMEARLNAETVKAETERMVKRTSEQADLGPAEAEDVDMKRPRDENAMNVDQSVSGSEAEAAAEDEQQGQPTAMMNDEDTTVTDNNGPDSFRERAKYIPLRLTAEERRLLRLLEAALSVSEYTDKVDVISYRTKTARIHAQIKDLCAILCGLTVAQNFKRGQQLIGDREFAELAEYFQDVFEIGRRYKIMNPEKMRDTYGKMQYMLMDSVEPEVQELLQFRCVRPLRTVYAMLEEGGALGLLDEPALEVATAEIVAGNQSRHEIQKRIKAKERARDQLSKKYRNKLLSEEDLLRCMYSISDNNSYLAFNRDPIDKAIAYMQAYFKPDAIEKGYSLSIQGGSEGARLTHSHERQYTYVMQSMTLWREIAHDMFKLWYLADADLLREGNYYRLQNTGQGLNRVQGAPGVGRAMQSILARCQRRLGSWVGSSVVHLGDHNVPNSMFFIDKYTKVPQILNPVVLVLDEIPRLAKSSPLIKDYLEQAFGSLNDCRKVILRDFARHAFDGSGADNFFDAGSCIDGRLTSAFEWCQKIEKKPYLPIFRLAGFTSFDGDWK